MVRIEFQIRKKKINESTYFHRGSRSDVWAFMRFCLLFSDDLDQGLWDGDPVDSVMTRRALYNFPTIELTSPLRIPTCLSHVSKKSHRIREDGIGYCSEMERIGWEKDIETIIWSYYDGLLEMCGLMSNKVRPLYFLANFWFDPIFTYFQTPSSWIM